MTSAETRTRPGPPLTLTSLLDETIEALTAMDAAKLDRLTIECERVRIQAFGPELRPLVEKRRVLGHLLRHSKRNLRVLRRVYSSQQREQMYARA